MTTMTLDAKTLTRGDAFQIQVGMRASVLSFEATPLLWGNEIVAVEIPSEGGIFDLCKRCGAGFGHYIVNSEGDDTCYRCDGWGHGEATDEADVVRRAIARDKAEAKRMASFRAKKAAARAAADAWIADNRELADALLEHTPLAVRDEVEGPNSWWTTMPPKGFLAKLANQIFNDDKPLTVAQTEAANDAAAKFAAARVAREAAAEQAKVVGHLAPVDTKVEVEVTVVRVSSFEVQSFNGYGTDTKYIVGMRTAAGHELVTFTTGAFGYETEKGETFKIRATVKELGEYNGTPQTTLMRVRKVK